MRSPCHQNDDMDLETAKGETPAPEETAREEFLKVVAGTADLVERSYFAHDPAAPHSRGGLCWIGAQLCEEAIKFEAPGVRRTNVRAGSYNVWVMHYVAEGHTIDEAERTVKARVDTPQGVLPEALEHSAEHAVCIAYDTASNTYVLMDRTFWQFLNEDFEVTSSVSTNGVVHSFNRGSAFQYKTARDLIERGYTVLDDVSLKEYLAVTADPNYWALYESNSVSVGELLKNSPPIQDHLPENELEQLLGRLQN